MVNEHNAREEIISRFQYLGLNYLDRPVVRYSPLESFNPREGEYYKENHEELDVLAERYAEKIRSGWTGPAYIKRAGDMGHGLFAGRRYAEGDFIGEYTGIVHETLPEEIPDRDDRLTHPERYQVLFRTDYSWDYPACFEGVELEIDACNWGNEMRFVNHSFHPNLEVEHTVVDGRWSIFYVARCEICRDEQFFVNYGDGYWEGRYPLLVLEYDGCS